MRKLEFRVKPVGFVEKVDGRSCIRVLEEYKDCLKNIEHFSHLIVLYWMNLVPDRLRKAVKLKPIHTEAPVLGVFATRFPARPNPLGLTTVRLIRRSGGVLMVEGLDAEDGTPVLDLKPYIPVYDKPRGKVKLPPWVRRHLREHRHEHNLAFKELLKLVKLTVKG